MKTRNTKTIGEVITKLMRNPKLEKKLENLDVLEIWHDIIGKNLNKYILDSSFKNNILEIKLESSTLRNELSYQKTDIIQKINKKIGKNIVKDIILK